MYGKGRHQAWAESWPESIPAAGWPQEVEVSHRDAVGGAALPRVKIPAGCISEVASFIFLGKGTKQEMAVTQRIIFLSLECIY